MDGCEQDGNSAMLTHPTAAQEQCGELRHAKGGEMAAGQDKVYHERQSGPAVLLTQGVRFTSLAEHVRAAPRWSNR